MRIITLSEIKTNWLEVMQNCPIVRFQTRTEEERFLHWELGYVICCSIGPKGGRYVHIVPTWKGTSHTRRIQEVLYMNPELQELNHENYKEYKKSKNTGKPKGLETKKSQKFLPLYSERREAV